MTENQVVFGSLQSNQTVYMTPSGTFYSTAPSGAGVWSPPPSFTAEQASALAKQGGGTISTATESWNVKPSQEFYASEISKAVGEPVTPTGQKGIIGNQITSEIFVGASGKVYEYNPSTSVLKGYGEVGGVASSISFTSGGIRIGLSPTVTEKVGGVEGFKSLMAERGYIFGGTGSGANLILKQGFNWGGWSTEPATTTPIRSQTAYPQFLSQLNVTQSLTTLQQLSTLPHTNTLNKMYEDMLTERASRPETMAYFTLTDLGIREAMKGYAGLAIMATGKSVEQARAIELQERKAMVAERLENPLIVAIDIGSLGTSLFMLTGQGLLASSQFGKPFVFGVAGVSAYQSSSLVGQTLIDTKTKGLTFETGGKLLMGITGVAGSTLLSYSASKMPTVWSETKWGGQSIKFEGESKSMTVGSADFEKNLVAGKTIAEVSTKGTREAYWGIKQQTINVKSYPESAFVGKLSEGFGRSETWAGNIVSTKETLFGKFTVGRSVTYPTSWAETQFIAEPVYKETSVQAGKGTIRYGTTTTEPIIKIIAGTESFTFQGTGVYYGGVTGTISNVKILSSVSKPLISKEAKPEKYNVVSSEGRIGSISYASFAEGNAKFMLTATKTFSNTKALIYNPKTETWVDIGRVTDVGVSLMKMPVITSASGGGGRGYGTLSFKPDETLGGLIGGAGGTTIKFGTMGEGIQPQTLTDIAKTATITSTSMWRPFSKQTTRYIEDTDYMRYPPLNNQATKTINNLSLVTRTKTLETFSTRLDTGVGTVVSLGLGTSTRLALSSATSTKQLQQLQLQQQQGLQQQLGLQNLLGLNINIGTQNFIPIVTTTGYFWSFGGKLPSGLKDKKKHKESRKIKLEGTRIRGSPLADLLSFTETEATQLKLGLNIKGIHPSGKVTTRFFMKSAGLRIPTAQQIGGFGKKVKGLKLW